MEIVSRGRFSVKDYDLDEFRQKNPDKPILRVENVSKRYYIAGRPFYALLNVDFECKPGEFIAIVGPSGAGKTTLLNIIAGFEKPTTGTVYIGDVEIPKLSDAELADFRQRNLGFVSQFFSLLPELSAYENVELSLILKGVPLYKREEIINHVFFELDIMPLRIKKITELSSGEQRRVAIARALVTDPRILLADEPTNDIDTERTLKIIDLFRDLAKRKKTTVIVATHDPLFLERVDKILYLRDGKIVNTEVVH